MNINKLTNKKEKVMRTYFTYLTAAVLFAAIGKQQLHAQNEILPKHEFTINVFGGLSTLHYKVDDATMKNGIGFGGGFGYHYFFNDRWALVTGLDAAFYKASLSAASMLSGQCYSFESLTHYSEQLVIENTLNEFVEKQNMWALQLPVMVQFMLPLDKQAKNHFYLALGGRLGYALSGNYKQSAESVEMRIVDAYSVWNPEYVPSEPQSGFSNKGSVKFSAFNAMAAFETGFRWKLGSNISLYTGLYFDYGFLNIVPDKSESALYTAINSSDPREPEEFASTSILSAHVPDYAETTDRQQVNFVQNTNRYTDKVNTIAAGVKIKLAFGIPKNKPSTVEPKKAKPAKKTASKAKVTKVPKEIIQSMILLSNTLFEFDKWNLKDEAIVELNKVIKWLNDNPTIKVEIEGHTDNVGTAEYNQRLSEERAKSVYDYFVTHGVQSSRLSYRGYGLTRPIADNSTAEGRQKNRRVELIIQ